MRMAAIYADSMVGHALQVGTGRCRGRQHFLSEFERLADHF